MIVVGSGSFAVGRFWHQGGSGANSGAGTAVVAGEIGRIFSAKKFYHRVEAPSSKGQEIVAIFLLANVNALTAKHAAEWVVGEESEVDFLVNVPLKEFQRPRFQTDLEMLGDAD